MFFKLHGEGKIGYKKLTSPDLGLKSSSHQSHIGLYDDILTFLPNQNFEDLGMFIYNNNIESLNYAFGRIQNSDDTFRSPNLKTGGREAISILSVIRTTVKEVNPNINWYLMWFGLESEVAVFFLFNENENDYLEISKIIDLKKSGRVDRGEYSFGLLLTLLENKVNTSGKKIIEDLEIISQLGTSKKYKAFDLRAANLLFQETGKKGEELIAQYLENLKFKKQIVSFTWYNQNIESGLPYDFHLQTIDQQAIYIDVKTTKYKFEQPMIFSNQEFEFISSTPVYNIYRVFDLSDEMTPKLKICRDSKQMANRVNPYFENLKNSLATDSIKLQTAKMIIEPSSEFLHFENEILLTN